MSGLVPGFDAACSRSTSGNESPHPPAIKLTCSQRRLVTASMGQETDLSGRNPVARVRFDAGYLANFTYLKLETSDIRALIESTDDCSCGLRMTDGDDKRGNFEWPSRPHSKTQLQSLCCLMNSLTNLLFSSILDAALNAGISRINGDLLKKTHSIHD